MSSKGSSALSTKRAAAAAAAASNKATAIAPSDAGAAKPATKKSSDAVKKENKDDESVSSVDDDEGAEPDTTAHTDETAFASPAALLSLSSSSAAPAGNGSSTSGSSAATNPLSVTLSLANDVLAATSTSDPYAALGHASLSSSSSHALAAAALGGAGSMGGGAQGDEQGAKRHKSKWSRDVSRLVGQHIPFQQFAPYNESGNTRNLLRGYCKMCTRKVTICCKKCHVFLCIEVFADGEGAETKSCWEVFHTEADPDAFMCKSSSNKRQEKLHRQQLATSGALSAGSGGAGGAVSGSSPTGIFALSPEEREGETQPARQPVELDAMHGEEERERESQREEDEAATVTFSWETKDKKKRARTDK